MQSSFKNKLAEAKNFWTAGTAHSNALDKQESARGECLIPPGDTRNMNTAKGEYEKALNPAPPPRNGDTTQCEGDALRRTLSNFKQNSDAAKSEGALPRRLHLDEANKTSL